MPQGNIDFLPLFLFAEKCHFTFSGPPSSGCSVFSAEVTTPENPVEKSTKGYFTMRRPFSICLTICRGVYLFWSGFSISKFCRPIDHLLSAQVMVGLWPFCLIPRRGIILQKTIDFVPFSSRINANFRFLGLSPQAAMYFRRRSPPQKIPSKIGWRLFYYENAIIRSS